MSNQSSIYMPLTARLLLLALGIGFLLCGCGVFPENVSVDDPRVQALLKAAAQ